MVETASDHAAVAPLSGPARQALRDWADDMTENGDVHEPRWLERVEAVRGLAGQLLNADPLSVYARVEWTMVDGRIEFVAGSFFENWVRLPFQPSTRPVTLTTFSPRSSASRRRRNALLPS